MIQVSSILLYTLYIAYQINRCRGLIIDRLGVIAIDIIGTVVYIISGVAWHELFQHPLTPNHTKFKN